LRRDFSAAIIKKNKIITTIPHFNVPLGVKKWYPGTEGSSVSTIGVR